jgi:hypothetical protein
MRKENFFKGCFPWDPPGGDWYPGFSYAVTCIVYKLCRADFVYM